jgi:hypothetical protein
MTDEKAGPSARRKRRELLRELAAAVEGFIRGSEELQRRPYTCVALDFAVPDPADGTPHLLSTVGFAKVCYPDSWDATTGVVLARQKALTYCARELLASQGAAFCNELIQRGIEETAV